MRRRAELPTDGVHRERAIFEHRQVCLSARRWLQCMGLPQLKEMHLLGVGRDGHQPLTGSVDNDKIRFAPDEIDEPTTEITHLQTGASCLRTGARRGWPKSQLTGP